MQHCLWAMSLQQLDKIGSTIAVYKYVEASPLHGPAETEHLRKRQTNQTGRHLRDIKNLSAVKPSVCLAWPQGRDPRATNGQRKFQKPADQPSP